jgi:hypothetical protein
MNRKLGVVLLLAGRFAFAQPDSALLLADCSDSSDVKRVVQSSDVVAVRHSFAGFSPTCYAVSVTPEQGGLVEGYLMGAKHPAVIQFERQEQNYIAQALPGPTVTKPNPPKALAPPTQYSRKLWNLFSSRTGSK